MATIRQCATCGAALTDGVPDGQCPECLIQLGLKAGVASTPAPLDGGFGLLPREFGDYELLEEIARGGMGVVLKARQKSLARFVAVKLILSGHFAGRDSIHRFRTEASSAAALQHPNIVAIHEVGVHQGEHYLAMDLVEGPNLAQFVKNTPLPATRAARYLKAIAEAIHYAHERGILHRDLKPSNILIDANDQPRVTDFGLAKRLVGTGSTPSDLSSEKVTDAVERVPTDLTLTGQVLGSPNYIAPEQASGKRGQVSRQSDVYSLGAILYHLLTGRGPFVSDTVADTLQQVLHEEPVSPRLLNPVAPRDLETICLKCLQKEPARRYAGAQELADDLGRFLRDEPVHARPVGRWEKAWRWCRRKPVVASLTATSLLLLLAVAIGSPIAAYRINQQRRRADGEAQNAKRAEQDTREQLWRSYLDQARANRWSGRAGRRFDSLEALRKAAEIRPSLDLRNEAIASLALVDLRFEREWTGSREEMGLFIFDPAYERYAKPHTNGTITLYRRSDDRELATFDTGEPPIYDLLFNPDGRYLVARYGKLTPLKIWDLNRRELVAELPTNSSSFGFSPDSRLLAVADWQKTISIYEVDSWRKIQSFPYTHRPWSLGFHPRGGKLAISSAESPVVVIRHLNTGEVQSLQHPGGVKGGHWHPDGNLLATACEDGQVYVWNVADGKISRVLTGHEAPVVGAQFTHRGDLLASGGWDGMIRLWDPFAGRALLAMPMAGMRGFSQDDHWLGGVMDANRVALFKVAAGAECRMLHSDTEPSDRLYLCDFSPDGELLASAHNDGVRIWNVREGKQIALFGEKLTYSVLFHPDGMSLMTSGKGGLRVWPIQRSRIDVGMEVRLGPPLRFGPSNEYTPVMAVSRDGQSIAAVSGESLRVYDGHNFREQVRLQKPQTTPTLSFSPDGRWLSVDQFYVSGPGVWIWDVASTQVVARLPVNGVHAAFSADGQWLVTGSSEEYHFWQTGSWKLDHTVKRTGTGGTYGMIGFSPDGRMVAVTDSQQSVRLLDPATGREFGTLNSPQPALLTSLYFSPNGRYLAAASIRSGIQLWDLRLIREQLAVMKLDWNLPPFPAVSTNEWTDRVTVTVLGGTNAPAAK